MTSIRQQSLSAYHARAQRRGVNPFVYWVTRAVIQPFLQLYLRMRRYGRDHIPAHGPVILCANHRSFLDPFVVGVCSRRPIYFVAKQELFRNRLQAWFLNSLGAFPVRRGESDEEMIETARTILARGDVVVIFPEGTRIRSGSLGKPKRGVGRLALESGAPVVPVAVTGTERARRGWRVRPVKVKVRCGRPLTFPCVESPSPSLAAEVTARIWPCIELQWEWLGGLPPLRTAAVVGAGSMGTGVAALLARAGLDVQLGCRSAQQAERIASGRSNGDYLPTIELPAAVTPSEIAAIEFAAMDLVVFAVPASGLPAAVAKLGDRITARSAVLVLTKGLVGPLATLPSRYVGERIKARGVAALGGPCHAGEAVARGASVVLAAEDRDVRRQLVEIFREAGLNAESSSDVTGVEIAASAKNVAALAAAAASTSGMNAAGAAAASVFSEAEDAGARLGARPETFRGLAGTGDLIATVLAPHSRNRRAGELLAQGVPPAQIEGVLGQTAEGLATVGLLAQLCDSADVKAPATHALASFVSGELTLEHWIADVRSSARGASARAA